jgi:hypothetical protein
VSPPDRLLQRADGTNCPAKRRDPLPLPALERLDVRVGAGGRCVVLHVTTSIENSKTTTKARRHEVGHEGIN